MGGQSPVVSFNLIIAKVPESKFDPVIMSYDHWEEYDVWWLVFS